jgi:hypothetical protein
MPKQKIIRDWGVAVVIGSLIAVSHASEHDASMPRVAIDREQRAALLQAAYACNRPNKSPQQQRECEALYEQMRRQIAQRTTEAHMQARPHVNALIEQLPQR